MEKVMGIMGNRDFAFALVLLSGIVAWRYLLDGME